MNGLLKGFPSKESISSTRELMEALPGIMEAVSRLPAALREMPAAPVILGAVSRVIASAIGGEMNRRGPSARFVDVCGARGLDEAAAIELHDTLVDEVRV